MTPNESANNQVALFIQRWTAADASERSNSQLFLAELCELLDVPRPEPTFKNGYAFEYTVQDQADTGDTTERRIDLYKRDCFVLESKQFQARQEALNPVAQAVEKSGISLRKKRSAPTRGTDRYDDAMVRARGQAERYVRALPESEKTPPFLLVVDVGELFELYADFTQAGKAYLPFPDPRHSRIRLADLADEKVRELLRLIWIDPLALDPSRKSAEVTTEIARHLAELAKSLEAAGHAPQRVAEFLTRCLFCMFAEDVGLLPKRSFTDLLESIESDGTGFQPMLQQLFREMNTGTGYSTVLRKKLLQFNGGLFADDTVLPVNREQLILLRLASIQDWRNVEPAIFGTLLERALSPHDRHKLGAHYTPRAYVERLVLPTVIEPLRAEWDSVRAAALTHARAGHLDKATQEIRDWHHKLCQIKVLDPACGSGNFLYVTLEHMKRLEGEVLLELEKYGDRELTFELQHFSVDPHQFLGIEVNPRAASITELVLWIGYLQWHFRTRGQTMPAEPIIKKFKNVECRDAVLGWDGEAEPKCDEQGNVVTVWDRRSYKKDLVTGREIPDESKRIPLLTYRSAHPAKWPETDYIVGNPPFLDDKVMRQNLGDGYVDALRSSYPEIGESTNYVLYWWAKAADLARTGKVQQFGVITTNSLRQTFNRRLIEEKLTAKPSLCLTFVIPDHPWVDTEDGAAVRIAMSVGRAGSVLGRLVTVQDESVRGDGSANVSLRESIGKIREDLTLGTSERGAKPLTANEGLSVNGMMLAGRGFVVSEKHARLLGLGTGRNVSSHLKPLMNGKDITEGSRDLYVIDLFGFSAEEARSEVPALYQHVLTNVKPERDSNNRPKLRNDWWIFGEPRKTLRRALNGLRRYIVTVETAKHRIFQFLPAGVLPEHKLVAIALEGAFHLGVLSSSIHVKWSLARGALLEDRPVYPKSECFDPFPFPACADAQRERIRKIAEELDAHRKRVQAQHSGLTLTGMYNVLKKLRTNAVVGLVPSPGVPLTAKEKEIHDKGLISVLKQLHDDLDAAVFDAYGWPQTLTDGEILERLVALNTERAHEEADGRVRWLRPEYQIPLFERTGKGTPRAVQQELPTAEGRDEPKQKSKGRSPQPKSIPPWPSSLPERMKGVLAVMQERGAKPFTAEEIARSFKRAQTAQVAEILETLCAVGKAREGRVAGTYVL